MLRLSILIAIFTFVFLSSLAFAAITYTKCEIDSCILTIEECSSGVLDIYSTSACAGLPAYEHTFSGSMYIWRPTTAVTYYARALCDDGVKKTACTAVTVRSGTTTTTLAKEKCEFQCCEGEKDYEDKLCPEGKECVNRKCISTEEGANYTWIIIAIVVVAITAFVFYFFVFKKKPKRSFEDLYRKWTK